MLDQLLANPVALISTIVLLVASILFFVLKKRGGTGDTIAILGTVNTGKTALFFKLRDWEEEVRQTFTSMSPNEATFIPKPLASKLQKPLKWLDFPGHGSKRLDLELSSARAIIFMLDSTNDKDLLQVSSYLLSLMTNKGLASRRVPILIACNKQEQSKAATVNSITTKLNKLITATLHNTHDLPDLGDTTEAPVTIGTPGLGFEFSQCAMPVSICGCSVTTSKLTPIVDFLASL